MAERRMFAKTIIDSDSFLDMPLSTQCLYFHLSMRADDDGFINNPKKLQRMIGCGDDDLKLLIAKSFLIPFESGIVVIKHWRIHNYIKKDRYKATVYHDEAAQLNIKKNKAYTLENTDKKLLDTECIHDVSKMDTQVSLGKDSLGKGSINKDLLPGAETASEPDEPIFITLTLNDKSEYPIPQSRIDEYKELYPAVDVEQELRNMKGWINSNPAKRKTKRGIDRFINSWLSKEQDKGGNYNSGKVITPANTGQRSTNRALQRLKEMGEI